jgi:hypothetical protein
MNKVGVQLIKHLSMSIREVKISFFGNFLLAKLLFSMLEAALLLFYIIVDRNRLLGGTEYVKWRSRMETFISYLRVCMCL